MYSAHYAFLIAHVGCYKGSKIRSTYISFAQKEKLRLEEVLAMASKEMDKLEKEVKRLKSAFHI